MRPQPVAGLMAAGGQHNRPRRANVQRHPALEAVGDHTGDPTFLDDEPVCAHTQFGADGGLCGRIGIDEGEVSVRADRVAADAAPRLQDDDRGPGPCAAAAAAIPAGPEPMITTFALIDLLLMRYPSLAAGNRGRPPAEP